MTLIAYLFPKLQTVKDVVFKYDKYSVFNREISTTPVKMQLSKK